MSHKPGRLKKTLLWTAALVPVVVLGVAPALLLAAWATANTARGRAAISATVDRLSGHTVQISGWTGSFPAHTHIDRLILRDADGVWCDVENADLDWEPSALLHRTLRIDRFSVSQLSLPRLPVSSAPSRPTPPDSKPFGLPVIIDLKKAHIGSTHIGASLAGMDISVGAIDLNAAAKGTMPQIDVDAGLTIAGFSTGQESFSSLEARVNGANGDIDVQTVVNELTIPGPQTALLKHSPLTLHVVTHLAAPGMPVDLEAQHALLQLKGSMQSENGLSVGHAELQLPDLAPFAAMGGVDLKGHTNIQANVRAQGALTQFNVHGGLGISAGPGPSAAAVGPDATFDLAGQTDGQKTTLDIARFRGRAVALDAKGGVDNGIAAAKGTLAVTDIGALQPGVKGAVTATFDASGLPTRPDASLSLTGMVDGGPMSVQVSGKRQEDGAMAVKIARADWKTLNAKGDLTLPTGAVVPLGELSIDAPHLADFNALSGQKLTGGFSATIHTMHNGDTPVVSLNATATDAGVPTASVTKAILSARVADPLKKPQIDATLKANGIKAANMATDADVTAKGVLAHLAVTAKAILQGKFPGHLATALVLDIPGKRADLNQLDGTWHGETLQMAGPATVKYGQPIEIDHLHLGVNKARIDLDGEVSPKLKLKADLTNITPALADPFVSGLQASGVLAAHASLTGTPTAPSGDIHVQGDGLRWNDAATQSLPSASLTLDTKLNGKQADLRLQTSAGSTHLTVNGQAPLSASGPVNLRVNGGVDLTLLDPILTPDGRRVRGAITIDMTAQGALPRPTLDGAITLKNGEVQDFAQGARIAAINGAIRAAGGKLTIDHITGQAGDGAIAVTGQVDPISASIPVNVTVHFDKAKPLSSDLLTATLSGDLTVKGAVQDQLAANGDISIDKATINIPERMPTSVAVLRIQKPGKQSQAAATAPSKPIKLDVTVTSPTTGIFIRGHGLDAVMGGKLHVGGDSSAPLMVGGFKMQHGTFSLAGTTLNFVRGKVSFNGVSATGKIDPSLDFEADNNGAGMIAKLLVGGYASAPKISLASEPPMPQDEILAHLLFGVSTQQLGPVQIASIADALATLSGASDGPGILDRVRSGLGLDRLGVSSGSGNSISDAIPNLNQRRNGVTNSTVNTNVEAGRYVANGVYLGAKQDTTGAGTQAELQIDLTKRLKVETDLGTGPGGNNIGLSYQFRY